MLFYEQNEDGHLQGAAVHLFWQLSGCDYWVLSPATLQIGQRITGCKKSLKYLTIWACNKDFGLLLESCFIGICCYMTLKNSAVQDNFPKSPGWNLMYWFMVASPNMWLCFSLYAYFLAFYFFIYFSFFAMALPKTTWTSVSSGTTLLLVGVNFWN